MKYLTRLADLLLKTDLDTSLRMMPDPTAGGDGGFSGLGLWRYQTATTSTPSTGQLQYDNLTIDSATNLYIHKTNDTGVDMSAFLNTLASGSIVYLQLQTDATQFATAIIGTPVLNGNVYTLPLTTSEGQGSAPANNSQVAVVISNAGGGGVTDHGALTGLIPDDDHTQYLNKDITRNITVGYTTDVEADTFTDPLVPDFSLEYFKTTTVTSDFTLNTPTGNSHGEYYITVDSGGPYTLTPGSNVVMMDSNVTLLASENYILNIHRYSATNTVAQLLLVQDSIGVQWLTVEDEGIALATLATTLDFTGPGVKATGVGAEKTITVGRSTITVTATSYTASTDRIILVDDDTAGGAVTIDLPAAASNTDIDYNVVKLGTTASVTLDGNASETINGATTHVLSSQWDAVWIVSDGTQWVIL